MTLESRRLRLHDKLKRIIDNVYYQSPDNMHLNYPCIIYDLSKINRIGADNINYIERMSFSITLIESTKISEYADDILKLPYCQMDNSFVKDGMYHTFFNISI